MWDARAIIQHRHPLDRRLLDNGIGVRARASGKEAGGHRQVEAGGVAGGHPDRQTSALLKSPIILSSQSRRGADSSLVLYEAIQEGLLC